MHFRFAFLTVTSFSSVLFLPRQDPVPNLRAAGHWTLRSQDYLAGKLGDVSSFRSTAQPQSVPNGRHAQFSLIFCTSLRHWDLLNNNILVRTIEWVKVLDFAFERNLVYPVNGFWLLIIRILYGFLITRRAVVVKEWCPGSRSRWTDSQKRHR